MEETTVSIIGIVIASIIMFIVPLTLIADRSDDISQLVIETATAEFVDEIVKTGKITDDTYLKYVEALFSTGNTYEIEMQVKFLDENTAKVVTDNNPTQIGNNTYYSIYTSQIEDLIGVSASNTNNNGQGKLILKHGDVITVTAKNNSRTLSQSLKSLYYNWTGAGSQIIAATATGTVVIDGSTNKE